MMSATGQSSRSERAPLLPKVVERDAAGSSGEGRSVSVKPEKSQSMVMYVLPSLGVADEKAVFDDVDVALWVECWILGTTITRSTELL